MAEPLTSSDIIRERMGFGPSSPDEKRRAAGAGISPLGTMERIRFEEGRGLSPMASKSEKEAYLASEVMAGRRPETDLPMAYGGIGERPEATTRRGLRMQQEWDKRYEMMIQEQELARKIELENRQSALQGREVTLRERQEARLQAAEAKRQDEDLKVSEQADLALNEVLGGFDPAGNPISGLDPDAPDYMQRRNDIIKRYPKALKDDAFKTAIATTDKSYFDTVNFNQQLQVQEESAAGIAERQEAAATRGEKERAAIREEERTKQEERDIKKQESDIDKLIRAERQKIAEFQGQPDSKSKQKSLLSSQNKILDLRIERADLRGLYFEDQEAFNAAMKDPETRLPVGTEVYIGRQKNIIR